MKAVNEVMFMIQLLRSTNISVKLPVMVRVHNVKGILMTINITMVSCTKHMDIRYEYVNEYLEDGLVKIMFVVC